MKKQVSQEILDCCQDRGELPKFFDIEIGKDFRLETKPNYHAEIREPRKVKIVVSTFKGVAAGAIHYYATIEADGIHIYSLENNWFGKFGKVYHYGNLCEEYKKLPRKKQAVWSSVYEIEVGRILTQQEIDADPMRWNGYYDGWFTNAFATKQDAIDQAKKIVKARFDINWVEEVVDNG